jgi:cytochrome P450
MAVDIIGDLCDRFTDDAHGGAYSVSAVCASLDVPPGEWPLFARWATDFLNPAALQELYSYLDVMIAERCRLPGEDLLSDLIGLDIDGDGLTVDDLHTIVAAVLAGVDVG